MKRKTSPKSKAQNDRERNDALNKSDDRVNGKLPGDYPPQEDMMNRRDTERVGMDVDNFSRQVGAENFNNVNEPRVSDPNDIADEPALGNPDDLEQPAAK